MIFGRHRARLPVYEALLDYLSDMCDFWEGGPVPGELRGKDLFCAVDALKRGDYKGAVSYVESAEKRAKTVTLTRPTVLR